MPGVGESHMNALARTRDARLLAIAVLAGAAVLLSIWISVSTIKAEIPLADPLEISIKERMAKLNLAGRAVELPTEKAQRAREAIKRRDYPLAHEIATQMLANSQLQNFRFYPYEDFIEAVSDVADPEFGARLDAWRA